MEDRGESNEFIDDDDPRGRPLSLMDAISPVRWPLSLLAGVCCGGVAVWAWVSSAPSWVTAVSSVTAAAWLAFAIVRLMLARSTPAEPGDAPDRGDK